LKIANEEKLKVFILGSRPEVNKKSVEKMSLEYPNLKIKGNSGPELDIKANPVSEVNVNLQSDIVKEINSFKPDLLFVAFGAPKQEIWISRHISKLNVAGAMAIGGTLDYYTGFVRAVPKFMENLGLEWLWRLIQEPTRVGRIFNAVVVFPLRAILSDH
ncbi:MAG TPA: WecB/TagA/CpsF family glycosyltransferase, partial [Candidatus Saccharimonadales bacterium]|nr:WecB/TagA/CpsF family glycosyltransferase [Candidatus Saccharimonadales bacterium]